MSEENPETQVSVLLKQRRLTKNDRVEFEKFFLGYLVRSMYWIEDIREEVNGYGISWRSFADKRHRLIWRAFEIIHLRTYDEREAILESELREETKAHLKANPTQRETPDIDPVRGIPGSIADQKFQKKMMLKRDGLFWFERELEAAGALSLAGGKVYLQEINKAGKLFQSQSEFEAIRKKLFG